VSLRAQLYDLKAGHFYDSDYITHDRFDPRAPRLTVHVGYSSPITFYDSDAERRMPSTAVLAGVRKDRIINTMTADELHEWTRRRRAG
jgi:hypothetical protein